MQRQATRAGMLSFPRDFGLLADTLLGSISQRPSGARPPFNIEAQDDGHYLITVAVAGLSEDEISIEQKGSVLSISAERDDTSKGEFLHRSIPFGPFEIGFNLADSVEVKGASLKDGLLEIQLEDTSQKEEAPRSIAISKS